MIIVDHSHLGRHVTGIERITLDLFSEEALGREDLALVRASSVRGMVLRQTVSLPLLALAHPGAPILCPGFPPSLPLLAVAGQRVIPYIHDLFLMTRRETLNPRARLYMAPAFASAVRRLSTFLVNSETTARELRAHCRADASITLYRPSVRDVFGIGPIAAAGVEGRRPIRIVAVGTVEPRKAYLKAAAIRDAVAASGHPAELHIIGREGWGSDAALLRTREGVRLHGYLSVEAARDVIASCDIHLCTSLEEGLGLPLLELQYSGLPTIVADRPVFREVLDRSGLFIDPDQPAEAARTIIEVASSSDRAAWRAAARTNIERWNRLAEVDRERVQALLERLVGRAAPDAAPAAMRLGQQNSADHHADAPIA